MRISDWSPDVCASDLKQALDRIEHDALRAHLLDRHFQANEQRLQIIIADLSQFGRIDRDMLDIDLVVGDELVEPETKRGDIVDQINGAFLEGDEHAGFVAFPSAMNEKRRGEQRLAATGRADDQDRKSTRLKSSHQSE